MIWLWWSWRESDPLFHWLCALSQDLSTRAAAATGTATGRP
jgi:hypothetical protein